MPKNIYSEINLYMTWHTKNNNPVLTDSIEQRVHHYLEHETRKTKNAFFHALDGTENHVHIVATIPPTLLISEWIGKLKGGCSFYINHEIANRKLLDWQQGYGVVSFGTKDLKWVIEYVKNQKQHHAQGSISRRLERDDDEDSKGR
jgi:REP element-mobilizing transposase RayT